MILDIVLVLVFVLLGGSFAAAEMSLVSLRESQVQQLADRNRRGQRLARLVSEPNRYLAAVQVGVTFAGFFSAAFGAATLSEPVGDWLAGLGMARGASDTVGFILVTIVVSYISLVLGELAPKRLALQRAPAIAVLVAGPLDRIASAFRPLIWLLSRTTDVVVRLGGGDPKASRESISEEELRDLVAAHESLGTDERRLIDDVFAAGERAVSEVMLPRTEVAFLESSLSVARAVRQVSDAPHSRYPVIGRNVDDVVGFVHVRDLVLGTDPNNGVDRSKKVADYVREVKWLPGSKKVLAALSEMRREGYHLAIVADEYGGTDGIVTLEDLIEEVIGDIRDEYDATGERRAKRNDGGEVEIDARSNLDEFAELTGTTLPDGPYETAGGYVMARLGRLPAVGDVTLGDGVRLTITEVDGRRASRIRVTPITEQPAAGADVAATPGSRTSS